MHTYYNIQRGFIAVYKLYLMKHWVTRSYHQPLYMYGNKNNVMWSRGYYYETVTHQL